VVRAEVSRARYLRNTRLRCNCDGYWFPHRTGGGACRTGYRHLFYLALRRGADELTALAEWAYDTPGRPADSCPF